MCLFALAENARAQTKFGFKAGINYVNNVYVNTPNGSNGENKYRLGYHAGVFGNIGISNKVFLRPELLFSNKGHKFDGSATFQPAGDGAVHLNYFNLPLLVEYHLFDRLYLLAGPEFGYLVSAKSKFDSETIDIKNSFDNDFDFGLATGLSFALNEKFTIDARYTHGLSSIVEPIQLTDNMGNPITNKDEVKLQNRAFQLSVSYLIK